MRSHWLAQSTIHYHVNTGINISNSMFPGLELLGQMKKNPSMYVYVKESKTLLKTSTSTKKRNGNTFLVLLRMGDNHDKAMLQLEMIKVHRHRPQEDRDLFEIRNPFLTSRPRLLVKRSSTGCPGQRYGLWENNSFIQESVAAFQTKRLIGSSKRQLMSSPRLIPPVRQLFLRCIHQVIHFSNTPSIVHSSNWLNPQAVAI